MSTWLHIWLVLAGITGLVWLVRFCALGAILRQRRILHSRLAEVLPDPAPRISVLVAARNEETNIESCIRTLLDQDYPDFEVIAIDDRSTDRTPDILHRLEVEAAGRLRVLTVHALRDGWFGKNNAMREGVEAASGDWLCFTDADCRQISTRTLSVAMGEALDHHVDFLCVTPVLETKTVWEKIIQPVCALVLVVWFLPGRVNNPAKKTAYANGAFMLLRRECYDAIGGHHRVRTQVNEDVHLARLAKQSAQRLRVVENDDLYRTRMYRTPGEAWRGWSRIFYGCLETWPRLATSAFLVTMFAILPWVSLVVALIGRALVEPEAVLSWSLAAYAWAGVILLKQAVLWRVYPVLRIGRSWSFTYVVGATLALAMLISAILKVTGATGTTWRGRTYRRDRLADAEDAPPRRDTTVIKKVIDE